MENMVTCQNILSAFSKPVIGTSKPCSAFRLWYLPFFSLWYHWSSGKTPNMATESCYIFPTSLGNILSIDSDQIREVYVQGPRCTMSLHAITPLAYFSKPGMPFFLHQPGRHCHSFSLRSNIITHRKFDPSLFKKFDAFATVLPVVSCSCLRFSISMWL